MAWYETGTGYSGCALGALNPPVAEGIMGRPMASTHSTTYCFDPTSTGGGTQSIPNPQDWIDSYSGKSFGHPVAMIIHFMGVRKTDPTTTPGVTLQNIANNWTAGDNSYEDKCIKNWTNLVKGLPHPMFFRLWHEPATSDWLQDGTAYIPAFRKVVNYVNSQTPNAIIIWCPNGDLGSGGNDAHQYFPGSSYCDWLGVDAYSKSSNGWPSYTNLQTWYNAYNSVNGTQNPDHRPNMICEWGIENVNAPQRKTVFDELKGLLTGQFSAFKLITYWATQASAQNGLADNPPGFLSDFVTWAKSSNMTPTLDWTTGGGPGTLTITPVITNPTAGATLNTQTVLIQARETTGNPVRSASLTVNGGAGLSMAFNSTTNRWEKTINAPLGSVSVVVTMTGTDGGTGTDSVNFTVSVVGAEPPPVISVLDPTEGQVLTTQSATVTADVTSTVGIDPNSVQVSVDGGATWQTMAPVIPGAGG